MRIRKYLTLAVVQLCLICTILLAEKPGQPVVLCCDVIHGCTSGVEEPTC